MFLARRARVGALVACVAVAGVAAGGQAVADPVTDVPVGVSATFDKESYGTGEAYRITVTVRNDGDAPAELVGAAVRVPNAGGVGSRQFTEVTENPVIAAGESRTQSFDAATSDVNDVVVSVMQRIGGERQIARHTFAIPVTPTYGAAAGVVFADGNGNAQLDPGEELAGATVRARIAARPSGGPTATTGEDGAFAFPELLTLLHAIEVVDGAGTANVGPLFVDIDGSDDHLDLRLAGTVPGAGARLAVSMGFDADVYTSTDTATLTAVITNESAVRATGVRVECVREDEWFAVPPAAAWGDLGSAAGATVEGGATREFSVEIDLGADPVIAEYGVVELLCAVGTNDDDLVVVDAMALVDPETGPEPTTTAPQPTAPTTTPGAPVGQTPPGALPDTGADVLWLSAAGLVALAVGAAAVLFSRRRRA